MAAWTQIFELEVRAIVDQLIATGDPAAWRALMIRIAPRLETWARGNRLLRRCRLAGDDDARAVMVAALERLAASDHENLRLFVAQAAPREPEHDLVAEVVRLAKLDDADPEPATDALADATDVTPLRAWLLRLVDFAARDHVRRRLGWGQREGEPTKRDLHSDALPLDQAAEACLRPPMTDRLTVSRLVAEVTEHIATFPDEMREAVMLWLDDVEPKEIASRLALTDAGQARALVRAGQARLRERFRGRSPVLFS